MYKTIRIIFFLLTFIGAVIYLFIAMIAFLLGDVFHTLLFLAGSVLSFTGALFIKQLIP